MEKGFSLLEALITLAVITGSLLGILSWQAFALRQVHAAYDQNLAVIQAQSLMERFRADPSAAGMALEFSIANELVKNLLPGGRMENQFNLATHACTVSIFWQDHGQRSESLNSIIF